VRWDLDWIVFRDEHLRHSRGRSEIRRWGNHTEILSGRLTMNTIFNDYPAEIVSLGTDLSTNRAF
jgi:hypothetical protein